MLSVGEKEDKVLGRIGAYKTMVEHFPMSILDFRNGKTYTSAFDFLIEVLKSCGLSTQELIEYLIVKIFGVSEISEAERTVDNRNGTLFDKIRDADYQKLEQSPFIKGLETGMKEILSALLTSIYTCSAPPILPDRVFDSNNTYGLMDADLKALIDRRAFDNNRTYPLNVPTSIIDRYGLLGINPLSDEGLLYYDVEGKNEYYKKVTHDRMVTEPQLVEENEWAEVTSEVPIYEKNLEVKLVRGFEPTPGSGSPVVDQWFFQTNDKVTKDLKITIKFDPSYKTGGLKEWDVVILSGGTTHALPLSLVPQSYDANKKVSGYTKITSILIGGKEGGAILDDKTYAYLSDEFPSEWPKKQRDTVKTGTVPTKEVTEKVQIPVQSMKDVTFLKTVTEYVKCERTDIESGETFVRVDYLPDYKEIEEKPASYPDFIVWFNGLSPNTLYRTSDMNAFIWYVLNKSSKNTYIEYNHTMWDSRIAAEKDEFKRESDSEWNDWYGSKTPSNADMLYPDGEFVAMNGTDNILYPILQMEKTSSVALRLHIPSQRYYLPKKRKLINEGKTPKPHDFYYDNATIYKFNRDYLNSIKILRPKLLLTKMCEYLLGFSLATIRSLGADISKKFIEAKLSEAIKNVIEADDMQVEDCYTKFSNDDYNQMLQEMLLAKYKASYYGGDANTARVHNVEDYINMLNSVNSSSEREGQIDKIKKLVTEVTVDPGTEAVVDYGFTTNYDGNVLKKLLYGITYPLIESLFTPQVLLLFYVNFSLTNAVKIDDVMGQDINKMMNFTINKLFGTIKAIIIYVKDKIVKILLDLFKEEIEDLLKKWAASKAYERIMKWKKLLEEMSKCVAQRKITKIKIPIPRIRGQKVQSELDEVDYADIEEILQEDEQTTPETEDTC